MPARTLPGLGLRGFWGDGENGWGTFHSEDLRVLSALVQGRFIDKVDALPGSPPDGNIYVCSDIEPTNPDKVAIRDNGAWVFLTPAEGWELYNTTQNYRMKYDGASWIEVKAASGYAIGGFFNAHPLASEFILRHIFAEPVAFLDDFGGSRGRVGTNPAALFTMTVLKNGAAAGSIAVSTGGVFTFSTTGGAISFVAGDYLEVQAPAIIDASIENAAFTLLGER